MTLADVYGRKLRLKPGAVVVADACETGLIELDRGIQEYNGFPAAFLAAGAGTVIATFWRVENFSTALLVERLYALMTRKGRGRGEDISASFAVGRVPLSV